MVKVIYVGHEGSRTEVDVSVGINLMEAAVRNGVSAIEGECGGALACATCHVHIPDEWQAVVGEPSPDELEMLEFGINVDKKSRLACQIAVSEEMDGITVLTPVSQR